MAARVQSSDLLAEHTTEDVEELKALIEELRTEVRVLIYSYLI